MLQYICLVMCDLQPLTLTSELGPRSRCSKMAALDCEASVQQSIEGSRGSGATVGRLSSGDLLVTSNTGLY